MLNELCRDCQRHTDGRCGGIKHEELVDCNDYEKCRTTNADRLRAMSDEELADYLRCRSVECLDISMSCRDCLLAWLQNPAEGGETGG